MRVMALKSKDPFEREKEIHRAEVDRLNKEIIRLKIKCGEDFTVDEMIDGFGNPPDMYIGQETLEKKPRFRELHEIINP